MTTTPNIGNIPLAAIYTETAPAGEVPLDAPTRPASVAHRHTDAGDVPPELVFHRHSGGGAWHYHRGAGPAFLLDYGPADPGELPDPELDELVDPRPLPLSAQLRSLRQRAADAQDRAGWADYTTQAGLADIAAALVELGRVTGDTLAVLAGLAADEERSAAEHTGTTEPSA